jgi:hypothetical protein
MYFFVEVYRGVKSRTSLFAFLPAISATSHGFVSVPVITTVLLGAPVLPMRWVQISTYLQSEQFLSIIFYISLPKISNNIFS